MINNKAALRSQLMKLVSKRATLTSLSEYNNCNPAEFGALVRAAASAASWQRASAAWAQ